MLRKKTISAIKKGLEIFISVAQVNKLIEGNKVTKKKINFF